MTQNKEKSFVCEFRKKTENAQSFMTFYTNWNNQRIPFPLLIVSPTRKLALGIPGFIILKNCPLVFQIPDYV